MRTKTPLRWGIVGTGWIAGIFAEALAKSRHGRLHAVASRTQARADAFARKHRVAKAYGTRDALLADPDLDVVYIATPHTSHCPDTLAAIRAGKHVLCEKPMAVTPAEAERMVAAARKQGVVLLEAFMYRTHPQTLKLQRLVDDGVIGDLRCIRSAFTFDLGVLPVSARVNPRTTVSMRGGSLYEVGGYCINASRMLAGEEPSSIDAAWSIDPETGVDRACAGVLGFPSGVVAHFDVGFHSIPTNFIEVVGATGRIHVASPWWPDRTRAVITVERTGRKPREVVVKDGGWIFTVEADHLADVVASRAKPLIPGTNGIGTARVLDTIWRKMHR
jgi:predicted dehydrogenase